MKNLLLFVLILALTGLGTQLAAQSQQTGDIQGTVTDPSGAVVAGATVTLKNLDTGATQATTTNQSGDYRFTLLKPNRYSVSATSAGFPKAETRGDLSGGPVVTANQ